MTTPQSSTLANCYLLFFLLLLFSSIAQMTYDNSALYFASMHIYETLSVAVVLVFGAIFCTGRVRIGCRTAILNTFTDGRQLFANVFDRTTLGIMFPTSPKACTAEGMSHTRRRKKGKKGKRGKESPVNSIVRSFVVDVFSHCYCRCRHGVWAVFCAKIDYFTLNRSACMVDE